MLTHPSRIPQELQVLDWYLSELGAFCSEMQRLPLPANGTISNESETRAIFCTRRTMLRDGTLPEQDLGHSTVAALSGAPTRSHRSCKHHTSRWMARRGGILVPSILAAVQKHSDGQKPVNLVSDWLFERRDMKLTVPATDLDDMKVFALNLDKPKSPTWSCIKESKETKVERWIWIILIYLGGGLTFTDQFLSTSMFGVFRSQCTIGGFRQWR